MSNLIRDFRRERQYSELRKLVSIAANMAMACELSENPTHQALAIAFQNQLNKVREVPSNDVDKYLP
jgi:hypothetical protein